jgi:hypothetical protein
MIDFTVRTDGLRTYIALCIALHCIALYCIVLHCIVLHCIALYCIVLHCIALHCILTERNVNSTAYCFELCHRSRLIVYYLRSDLCVCLFNVRHVFFLAPDLRTDGQTYLTVCD